MRDRHDMPRVSAEDHKGTSARRQEIEHRKRHFVSEIEIEDRQVRIFGANEGESIGRCRGLPDDAEAGLAQRRFDVHRQQGLVLDEQYGTLRHGVSPVANADYVLPGPCGSDNSTSMPSAA